MLNPLEFLDKPKRKYEPSAQKKCEAIMKGLEVLRSVKGSKDYPMAAAYIRQVNRYVGYFAIDSYQASLDILDMKQRARG